VRRVLRAAAATLGAALVVTIPSASPLEKVEREVYLMGTTAKLETYAPSRERGIAILDRMLAVLEETEDELSTWRPNSAVSALNHQPVGHPWLAPPGLCAAFPELLRVHRISRGAFDPAIGALTDAWGIHDDGRAPSPLELAAARRASGMRLLQFDSGRCTLTKRADVRIDVGAWGKGDALDRVRRAVASEPWLIDFGGQIAVNGVPPDQPSWSASLAHPQRRREAALTIWIGRGSVATSAGSERDLQVRGQRLAHHLDPRTGEPATFNGSVSVWHADALVADALSTALYVMGPEEGLPWAEQHGVAACFMALDGNRVVPMTTTRFDALLSH
jgi:FAD:protein FMN transferase